MKQTVKLQELHTKQAEIGRAFNENPRVVIRCGRRFGKTTLLERCASKWAYQGLRVGWFGPTYKLNLPTYKRILRTIQPIVVSKSKIDQVIETQKDGCVEFWTLQDEDAGRSRFYDRVIIDEGSLVPKGLKEIWEQAISPTLLDRQGKAVMAGTPKGIDPENFFYEACTDKTLGWQEFHAPTAANPKLDPQAVAKLIHEYPPLVYEQEFLAQFVDWRGSAFFSEVNLLENGQPVEYPSRCDQVFAVVDTALKDGLEHDGTAVIYCARNKIAGHPLVILDWDVIQIQGALLEEWLPTVNQRLEDLARETSAREGNVGIWVEDKGSGTVLIQQAQRRELPVFPIEEKLVDLGKEGRALSVSGYVYRGDVKFSRYAYDKVTNYKGQTRNHLLAQVCGFRVGTKTPHHMDALDTFTYAVGIALGDSTGW
jgi:phage terminase large subunit-like protein